ncbi:MAG: hypothetical protein QNJ63_28175 [Calothrix sp. MO_192.B10]|nr:hypothetical protein [Calothrix sp. MO_192.B10]
MVYVQAAPSQSNMQNNSAIALTSKTHIFFTLLKLNLYSIN